MGLSSEGKGAYTFTVIKEVASVPVIRYYSGAKSQTMGWVRHVERMGERRGACRGLVRKPKGKRSLGRRRHVWEDNTKMHIQQERQGNRLD